MYYGKNRRGKQPSQLQILNLWPTSISHVDQHNMSRTSNIFWRKK